MGRHAPKATPASASTPAPGDPSTPAIPTTPVDPAAACADVTGAWRGPLDGTATLTPGLPTANKLDMNIDALIIVKIPSTQAVTGTVKCGKFEGKTVDQRHRSAHRGHRRMHDGRDGRQGTFGMHQDDGAKVAIGTFRVAR